MSQLTNYGENKLADWVRGQGLTLPSNWYIALGSAASDAGVTELAIARQPVVRSLATWSGTQGDGTTLPSTGTSHVTSNNAAVVFGTPPAPIGTATHVGLFDATTGGTCWLWQALQAPIVTGAGSPNPIELAAGSLRFKVGVAGCTNYLSNRLLDLLFRAQPYSWPSPLFVSLYSAAPTNAGGGSEMAASGYARVSLTPSLENLSGTQAPGSTSPSSGAGGVVSNNDVVAFAPFTGTITAAGIHDAATGGNLLLWASLGSPTSVQASGEPPTFQPGALSILIA